MSRSEYGPAIMTGRPVQVRRNGAPSPMTLTIDLTPELEARLRDEAAKLGVDARTYVVKALAAQLEPPGPAAPDSRSPSLDAAEANLLRQINLGVPAAHWEEYRRLVGKRPDLTLTPDEQARLVALSDEIEEANARRMRPLVELARLRRMPLEQLMDELGIRPVDTTGEGKG